MSQTTDADASASPEPADIDWAEAFATMGHEPHEPFGMGEIDFVVEGATPIDDANGIVREAIEAGELVRVPEGVRVAGHDPPQTESEDADDEPVSDETAATEDDDGAEHDDGSVENEALQERVDGLEETVERQQRQLAQLNTALRNLLSMDKDAAVRDYAEHGAVFREEVDELGAAVDDIMEQVDSMTTAEGRDRERVPREVRIRQLRQRVVEKADNGNGGVTYDALAEKWEISQSHAANLIDEAADHAWFETVQRNGKSVLRAKLDRVPSGHVFRQKNSHSDNGGSE